MDWRARFEKREQCKTVQRLHVISLYPGLPKAHGAWFLFEPAEAPFPCTEVAARVWLQMELEMWEFCVQRCLTSDCEPLFPVLTQATLPAHLL
jgi:hypothetical protein